MTELAVVDVVVDEERTLGRKENPKNRRSLR